MSYQHSHPLHPGTTADAGHSHVITAASVPSHAHGPTGASDAHSHRVEAPYGLLKQLQWTDGTNTMDSLRKLSLIHWQDAGGRRLYRLSWLVDGEQHYTNFELLENAEKAWDVVVEDYALEIAAHILTS